MNHKKFIRVFLIVLCAVLALWLAVAFLLPLVLPFLLGLLLARAAKPLAALLASRLRIPRVLASGVAVLGLFAALLLLIFLLCRAVCGEAVRFSQEIPALLTSLEAPMSDLQTRLLDLSARAPAFLSAPLQGSIDSIFQSSTALAGQLPGKLLTLVSSLIKRLPDIFLFLVTTILASFMISSQYDAIWRFLHRQIPAKWKNRYDTLVSSLRATLIAWLKAQLKLIGVTFFILTMGMMLLNVSFPLLFGGLIALIDALPVFGTGTILIPWGILSFLRGDMRMGIGLFLLYGTAYLTRSVLEPRLLGKQMGLNPLLTLLALYAGYRILGVIGMITFPIGAILIKQFWDLTTPHGKFERGERA